MILRVIFQTIHIAVLFVLFFLQYYLTGCYEFRALVPGWRFMSIALSLHANHDFNDDGMKFNGRRLLKCSFQDLSA